MTSPRPAKRSLDADSSPNPKRIHHDIIITPAASTPASSESADSTDSSAVSSPASFTDSDSSKNKEVDIMLGSLLVKKLSKKARVPTRGSKHAAGFDLYSSEAVVIPAQSQGLVPTDISIAIPEGTYGRVAPRSGLAVKHFVDVGAGVVDYDYRGPLAIVLFNFGKKDFVVEEGDRIAQLVLEKIHMCEAVEVEELDTTDRGSNGFGSTGVKVE